MTDGLDELPAAKPERGPVSVVGWSLGGLHAVDLVGDRLAQRAGHLRPFTAPAWADHWLRAAA